MNTNPQRQTAVLVEAGLVLASELDLDALLQRIPDLARDVVGAGYGAVGVVGDDGLLLRFVYSGHRPAHCRQIGDLPHGRGLECAGEGARHTLTRSPRSSIAWVAFHCCRGLNATRRTSRASKRN